MEVKILVALVAAGCSIIIALIGLITSFITNRSTNKTLLSIERYKNEKLLQSKNREFQNEQLSKYFQSLKDALISLQTMKDNSLIIINSVKGSLTQEEAIKLASEGVNSIFTAYKGNIDDLDSGGIGIREKFHQAKEIALSIQNIVSKTVKSDSELYIIDSNLRNELTLLRNEISDIQTYLLNEKSDKLLEYACMIDGT